MRPATGRNVQLDDNGPTELSLPIGDSDRVNLLVTLRDGISTRGQVTNHQLCHVFGPVVAFKLKLHAV